MLFLPGGKVDAHETTVEALIREVKEELDIILNPFEMTKPGIAGAELLER